ncbi:DUF2206 domain-containing protein [Chloroflexota bacterium]
MTEREVSSSPAKWFGPIITIIVLTNIATFLDIPVLRQISGFILLTFVPGFLFLSILKLNNLGLVEKIVLSVGLSVAFSMFFGTALNGLLYAVGYSKPLSTVSLLIAFSTATIILAVIAYIRNRELAFSLSNLRLTTREKLLLIVPSLFPLLSIVGTRTMNLTDNNVVLIVLYLLILVYVVFVSFTNRRIPQKVYPIAIFLIGISLLLMFPLRSNYIVQAENAGMEFYYFWRTWDNLYWHMFEFTTVNSVLSVTLLPAIYQSFLDMNLDSLFKLLYSFLFSISPLVIYILAEKYIGSFYAFLASFFFMSQTVFLRTAGEARVVMAILFVALAVMVLFHNKISDLNKRILFFIFAGSIIVSHYSGGYIFFFIVALTTWIVMPVLLRIMASSKERPTPSGSQLAEASLPHAIEFSKRLPPHIRKNITTLTVVTVFVMIFIWFSQITGPSFISGVNFIEQTILSMQEFFTWGARHSSTQELVGLTFLQTSTPHRIDFIITWATFALIAIGVIGIVYRYRERVLIPWQDHPKSEFLKTKIEVEYLAMALVCSLLLVVMVVVPFLSLHYEYQRLYMLVLTILSPFFVIGGIILAKYIKLHPSLVILVVLVPWFISVTGLLDQVSGVPKSIILNSAETSWDSRVLIHEQESYALKWLDNHADRAKKLHAYRHWYVGIQSQGRFSLNRVVFFNDEYQEGEDSHYIYLSDAAIPVYGRTGGDREDLVVEHPDVLVGSSQIYTNGHSEVFYK